MSDFTASNGIPVIPDRHGGYQFVHEIGQLGVLTGVNADQAQALREFFEAHPEPKPWRDAKDGEIWALSIGPNTNAYEYDACNAFFDRVGSRGTKGISAGSAGITAGHRIWPEVAS